MEMLLEAGADIERKARNAFTTLHIAAFLGWESVVQELLERGADPAAETQWFGAKGSNEYEHDMAEMAERPMSDLLRRWFLGQRIGVTARQLAGNSGLVALQQLLG